MWEYIDVLSLSQQKEEHATLFFTEHLSIEMKKKTEIPKNQPAYLQLSILQLSKILLHQFWCDYEKPIYREKSRLYYMDICFIVSIKTDDIYKDIAEDFESGKVIGLMESELGRNIMIKFVELRAKNYSYLIDDDIVKMKKKKTQKCVS